MLKGYRKHSKRKEEENMKKLTALLLSGILAFSMTACGTGNVTEGVGNEQTGTTDSVTAESDTKKDRLDEILERGYIIVGTEGTYSPNSYHDENDNLVGFDVEVAAAIAKNMGVEVRYVEMEWASIFAALDAGQIDTVVNEVGYTEERAEKYDFSKPYAFVQGGILVKGDNTDINSFEDLDGKIAANESTSTWGATAQEYGATPHQCYCLHVRRRLKHSS